MPAFVIRSVVEVTVMCGDGGIGERVGGEEVLFRFVLAGGVILW